jgi:hypothetical protein
MEELIDKGILLTQLGKSTMLDGGCQNVDLSANELPGKLTIYGRFPAPLAPNGRLVVIRDDAEELDGSWQPMKRPSTGQMLMRTKNSSRYDHGKQNLAGASPNPKGILRLGRTLDRGDGAMINKPWMPEDKAPKWHGDANPNCVASGEMYSAIKEGTSLPLSGRGAI